MPATTARHLTPAAKVGRRAIAIAAFALAACIAPAAYGDITTNSTITLTDATTDATVAHGSFTYDSTIPGFSAFTVTDIATGNTLNFTTVANTDIGTQGTDCAGKFWSIFSTSEADPAAAFALLAQSCTGQTPALTYGGAIFTVSGDPGYEVIDFHESDSATPNIDETGISAGIGSPTSPFQSNESVNWGIAIVPPVATPEPSSLILLSSALLAVAFVVRKRIARGDPEHH